MVLGSIYPVVFLVAGQWLSNQIVNFLFSHVSLLIRRLAGYFAHPFCQSQGYASIPVPSGLYFPFFLSALLQVYFSFRYGVIFLQGMLAVVDDLPLVIGYQLAHVHQLLAYLIGLYLVNQEVVTIPVVPHACPFAIVSPRPCGHPGGPRPCGHSFLWCFSRSPHMLALPIETRVLPCSVVHTSLPEMGREVSDFRSAPRALYSSGKTGPAGVTPLSETVLSISLVTF